MLKKETLRDKLEKLMMAVTFAEAGEHETALRMMGKRPDRRRKKRIRSKEEKRPDHRPVLMA